MRDDLSEDAADDAVPPVSADDVRRIVADILVREAMDGAHVEFGVGDFYGAPDYPIWLVYPRPHRLGGSLLFAFCPQSGKLLFRDYVGE